jgi:alkylation response protein AidB-like acyl-CoA dehydrogenase
MTARAAALFPLINERAEEAAAAAALPTDLVEDLESQGFFCMALPRNLGGLELDPVTMLLTAETLAWADGSTAWTVMIGNSSIAFAWLDQAVAARLLNGRSGQPLASMFAPTGRAVEVDGGYQLSGRWHYVSGATHATMIILGFVVVGPDGNIQTSEAGPIIRSGVVSAGDVMVETTWRDAAGMRGSGSHDVFVDDVFVPMEHTLMPFIGEPRINGPLYQMPFAMGTPLLTGVPLGVARRALDELNKLCRNKIREDIPIDESEDVQIRIAVTEAALRASRSFVLDSLGQLWADVQAGGPSLNRRVEFALAAQNAMRSAVDAVNLAFEIAGASASRSGSVIQRCWRDVNVMSQHVSYSRSRLRGAGQVLLGVATNLPNL